MPLCVHILYLHTIIKQFVYSYRIIWARTVQGNPPVYPLIYGCASLLYHIEMSYLIYVKALAVCALCMRMGVGYIFESVKVNVFFRYIYIYIKIMWNGVSVAMPPRAYTHNETSIIFVYTPTADDAIHCAGRRIYTTHATTIINRQQQQAGRQAVLQQRRSRRFPPYENTLYCSMRVFVCVCVCICQSLCVAVLYTNSYVMCFIS